jgi:hypothetical protein
VWSVAGIQSAFYVYAAACLLAALVAAVMVGGRTRLKTPVSSSPASPVH